MEDTRRNNIIAFFAGSSLFLATLEYLIPKPLPFFRIGLANIPILLVLPFFRFRDLMLLAALKTFGQAFVNGTLLSYVFLFSAAGTVSSVLVMYLASYPLRRSEHAAISLTGVSVLGSLASNLVQIACSVLFIFGRQSWILFFPFLLFGGVSGIFVGLFAERLRKAPIVERLKREYQISASLSSL